MSLTNWKINFILAWSANCVIKSSAMNQATTFTITDTTHYAPAVILSTEYNWKLLQQLKSGLKEQINWNKYPFNVTIQAQLHCLDYLINPSFRGVNSFFVLS